MMRDRKGEWGAGEGIPQVQEFLILRKFDLNDSTSIRKFLFRFRIDFVFEKVEIRYRFELNRIIQINYFRFSFG